MLKSFTSILGAAGLALSAIPGPAGAEVLHAFDPGAGQFPEGVTTDSTGNVYASLAGPVGEIRQFTQAGELRPFFQLEPAPPPDSFGILGLTTDGGGRVYAAVASFDPRTHGVWRINRRGRGFRIQGTEDIAMPNALVFDRRGFLYVTDTLTGAVWRIGHNNGNGRPVDLWVQDPLLEGDGSANRAVPLGANGIALGRHRIFVAVTEGARVVSINIRRDGSPGSVEVFSEHPDLFLIDGLTTANDGEIFGAVVALNGTQRGRIMRIPEAAAPETVVSPADGIQLPTSLSFGATRTDRQKLFVANWDVPADQLGLTPMPALHVFETEFNGRIAVCPMP